MLVKLPNLSVSLFPKANFLSERRLYRYILSLGLRHSGPHRVLRDSGGERLHGSLGKLKLRPSAAAHAPQWEVARRQSAPSPQAQC